MLSQSDGQRDGPVELMSFWRVHVSPDVRVKLFVHLLDNEGQVVAQHDSLDVAIDGLRPGDEFAQLHTLSQSSDLESSQYALQIGVYDAQTLTRLLIPTGNGVHVDRLLLHSIQFD